MATESDPAKLAALFIYINKTCFNGLYRENRKGVFNASWAGPSNAAILDTDGLLAASAALQKVDIRQQQFTKTRVRAGDFYYLDPPYDQSYGGYHHSQFGEDGQRSVASLCRAIDAAGGMFLASNADTPFVRDLYSDFVVESIMAKRSVNRNGAGRGKVGEVLVRNY